MAGVIEGYRRVIDAEAEVIQVSPNLLESARAFFGAEPVPYAFICDPDGAHMRRAEEKIAWPASDDEARSIGERLGGTIKGART